MKSAAIAGRQAQRSVTVIIAATIVAVSALHPAVPSVYAATFLVTNTNDAGAGSLRQSIIDANTSPEADTIGFNIPGSGVHTIAPASPLPTLLGHTTIDGYTQP